MNSCKCSKHKFKNIKINKSSNAYENNLLTYQMCKDNTYTSQNNFIQSLMIERGASWNKSKIPNGVIGYCINYGETKSVNNPGNIDSYYSGNTYLKYPQDDARNAVHEIVKHTSGFLGVKFRFVTDPNKAIISFNFIDYERTSNPEKFGALGFAYPPWSSTEIKQIRETDPELLKSNSVNSVFSVPGNLFLFDGNDITYKKGTFSYTTLIHELGHVLGLNHPHDLPVKMNGVSSNDDVGTYGANINPITVMGYKLGSPYTPGDDYHGLDVSDTGFASTFGPLDIAALQFLYGRSTSHNNEDTIYKFPTDDTSTHFWESIFDTNGEDTVDASHLNLNVVIDLRDSSIAKNTNLAGVNISRISNKLFGGFTIAKGTVIENMIGGKGDDKLIGNDYGNKIDLSVGGNDNVDGSFGYDTVIINDLSTKYEVTNNYEVNQSALIKDFNGRVITLKNVEKIRFLDLNYILSEICFGEGSIVLTDQGKVKVEDIKINIHTINNKKVKRVTKSSFINTNYVVKFKKGSLGFNTPDKDTILTRTHKVSKKLINAEKFINNKSVTKVKYTGQILYNILLDTHDVIKVNNLTIETLHPKNYHSKC